MQARYMDPATGRFVSEDNKAADGNLYIYSCNSPTCMVDADGHEAKGVSAWFCWLSMLGSAFAIMSITCLFLAACEGGSVAVIAAINLAKLAAVAFALAFAGEAGGLLNEKLLEAAHIAFEGGLMKCIEMAYKVAEEGVAFPYCYTFVMVTLSYNLMLCGAIAAVNME